MSIDKILDCLNSERIRCTYSAVAEVLGVPAQSVGQFLGIPRPEASWVVNARTGRPTGYAGNQMHPELFRTTRVITTGDELRRQLPSGRTE